MTGAGGGWRRSEPLRRRGRAALAALLLCAVQGGAAAPARPILVTAWTHAEPESPEYGAVKAAADAFNRRQHTYRVEFLPSMRRDFPTWVHHQAANGSLPCLLDIDGPYLAEFAWPQDFQPIDRFVPRKMLDDFLPSVVEQGRYQGRLYSLGQFESGLVLWGNLRYLRAVGARIPTLKAPWRLDEFEQVLARLAATGKFAYPLTMAFYNGRGDEFITYAYSPILQGFGGDLIDRGPHGTAKGVLDGPRSLAAVRRIRHWFDAGWAGVRDSPDDLEKGRVALAWNGHWHYRSARQALGRDLVVLPLPDFGRGVKTGMGSWAWAISSTCPAPEGAWAFMADLLSTEGILRMTNLNGAVPARRSALRRSPLYGAGGPLHLVVRQLELGGVPRPATPAYGSLSQEFRNAIVNIVMGGDAQTELSNAADRIDREIAAHDGYPYP
ncbi:extracellular solute-binding protein [Massilia rhizosphaerae]|uniref:extracellular solute-binding protein n=1 Tax=Massilia rhizosphaerae TaxID=2784389 RepID=UPI0018DB94FC|nr:extracellular solute-binding protein [Massilia rhizosphaerae]